MDELDMRVKAALIQGKSAGQIIRQLRREGVDEAEIASLLARNEELRLSAEAGGRNRRTARIAGVLIFVASLALNLHLLFFTEIGWIVGFFWALTFYGLVVIIVGDFLWVPRIPPRPPHERED